MGTAWAPDWARSVKEERSCYKSRHSDWKTQSNNVKEHSNEDEMDSASQWPRKPEARPEAHYREHKMVRRVYGYAKMKREQPKVCELATVFIIFIGFLHRNNY